MYLSGIVRAGESESQSESEKAKVSVTQRHNEHNAKGRILAGEPVRAHAEAKVICIIYLLSAPQGIHFDECVCVCAHLSQLSVFRELGKTLKVKWRIETDDRPGHVRACRPYQLLNSNCVQFCMKMENTKYKMKSEIETEIGKKSK